MQDVHLKVAARRAKTAAKPAVKTKKDSAIRPACGKQAAAT
jgi:hypothetical protein